MKAMMDPAREFCWEKRLGYTAKGENTKDNNLMKMSITGRGGQKCYSQSKKSETFSAGNDFFAKLEEVYPDHQNFEKKKIAPLFFSGVASKSINPHRCANQHTSKSSSFFLPPSAYTANSTVNIVYRPRLLFSKPCFSLTYFLQVFYGLPP